MTIAKVYYKENAKGEVTIIRFENFLNGTLIRKKYGENVQKKWVITPRMFIVGETKLRFENHGGADFELRVRDTIPPEEWHRAKIIMKEYGARLCRIIKECREEANKIRVFEV